MAFADSGTRTVLYGYAPCQVTLAGTVEVGDPIGYSSGWKAADADNSIEASLVAAYAGVSGDVIHAFGAAVVDGFTGGTAGDTLYVSDTAGDYSDSAGTVADAVGVMYNATTAYINPRPYDITNANVDSSADIALSKLEAVTDGNIIVGSASNVAAEVTPSGDVGLANDGTFSISSGVIVNADVNNSAAIAYSKLALSGNLVGDDAATHALDDTATALPVLYSMTINGGADASETLNIPTGTKIKVIDFWCQHTGGNGEASDTVKLTDGTNDISDAMDWSGNDNTVVRASSIDDANATIDGGELGLTLSDSDSGSDLGSGMAYVLAVNVA